MSEHTQWCRDLFASINHGGLWFIPRTGLIFRKTGNSLLLIGYGPPDKIYRKVPRKLMDEMREVDFEQHCNEFGEAGVPILKASVLRDWDSFDAARAHYNKMDDDKLVVRNVL